MNIKDKYFSIEQLIQELDTTISRVWYLVRKEKIKPTRRQDLNTQECFEGYNSKTRLLFTQSQLDLLKKSHVKSRKWNNVTQEENIA